MKQLTFSTYLIKNPIKRRQIIILIFDLFSWLSSVGLYLLFFGSHFTWKTSIAFMALAILFFFTFYFMGLYNVGKMHNSLMKLIICSISIFCLTGFTWITVKEYASDRVFLTFSAFIAIFLCCVNRYLMSIYYQPLRKLAFLGYHPLVEVILSELNKLPKSEYYIIKNEKGENKNVHEVIDELLGTADYLDIIVITEGKMHQLNNKLLTIIHNNQIDLYDIRDFYSLLTGKVFVPIEPEYFTRKKSIKFIKRNIDIIFGIFASAASSLWVLIIAALVWWESGAPILFKQEKVGLNGRIFTLLKFRSMVQSPDAEPDAVTKVNDPRITKSGYFLRLTHLDELPQLIHILKGDMSLIGPRPLNKHLEVKLSKLIPSHALRYLVTPGLTGWAQINHPDSRCQQGQVERLQYDLFYVRYQSALMETFIFMKSLKIMFTGFGAR